jgi:hypothetical protein
MLDRGSERRVARNPPRFEDHRGAALCRARPCARGERATMAASSEPAVASHGGRLQSRPQDGRTYRFVRIPHRRSSEGLCEGPAADDVRILGLCATGRA